MTASGQQVSHRGGHQDECSVEPSTPLRNSRYAWWGIAAFGVAAKLSAYAWAAHAPLGRAMCQWDCEWYASIVERGYDTSLRFVDDCCWQANWAFFPLLPVLVSALRSLLGGTAESIGVLVSSACFLAFTLVGARLRRITREERSPGLWIAFVLCWPFGFYFHALYSESLFAFLATLALLWLAQDRVWPAALATAALTATRPTGIVLSAWIGLRQMPEAWRAGPLTRRGILLLLPAVVSAVGLLAFMAYLYLTVGDALAFQHVQEGWGRRGGNPVVVLWAPFSALLRGRLAFEQLYYAGWAVAGFGATAWLAFKRRSAEAWLCGVPVLIALSSGQLISMPRFVATNPAFLLAACDWLGLTRHPACRWAMLAVMLPLQAWLLTAWFGAARFLM